MEKIYYQTLKETLFHEKLENGLEVYLLPKVHPSQTTHQTVSPQQRVRTQIIKGPYFNSDSTNTGVPDSKSPAYPTHQLPKFNVKL